MHHTFFKLVDAYGKQVKGESCDARHIGWIDIDTYSFAGTQGSFSFSAPAPAGPPAPPNVSMSKAEDSASPIIRQASATGTYFQSAILEVVIEGPKAQVMSHRFEDVLIISYQFNSNSERAPETFYIQSKKMGFSLGSVAIAQGFAGGFMAGVAAAAALRTLPKK